MSSAGPAGDGHAFLTADEEQHLLRIARAALETFVRERVRIDLSAYAQSAVMHEKHGAFVTVRCDGALRGCVGQTAHHLPLAEAVRDSAINAGTQDPRFPPITPDELGAVRIEISALGRGESSDTPFFPVRDVRDLRVGRDGVMMRYGGTKSGLLLPQVAVERGWDMPAFLDALCAKAGLDAGAWNDPEAELYRFTVQHFCEDGYSVS